VNTRIAALFDLNCLDASTCGALPKVTASIRAAKWSKSSNQGQRYELFSLISRQAVRQTASERLESLQIPDDTRVQQSRPRPEPEREQSGRSREASVEQATDERRFRSRIDNIDANRLTNEILDNRRSKRSADVVGGLDDRISLGRSQELITSQNQQISTERLVECRIRPSRTGR